MSEPERIENRIAELIAEHGAVPPPWFMFPNRHPYDIFWCMGTGESYGMIFGVWWERQKHELDVSQRIDYFRRWPPPPRWLTWMIDAIWDLTPWELDDPESFDYAPYFAYTEALNLGTQAEFERDLNDFKWLGNNYQES